MFSAAPARSFGPGIAIMMEDVLSKIARQIMTLDEDTLTALVPRYKNRMLDFAPTREWEESVIIYFLINGLRTKNSMFNEKIKEYMLTAENGAKSGPHIRPRLRLVRSEEDQDQAEDREPPLDLEWTAEEPEPGPGPEGSDG